MLSWFALYHPTTDSHLDPLRPAVAHLAFIFCCFVWGTTFILLERVTHVFGPVEIGIWRMLSGAAVVGVFWWLRRGEIQLRQVAIGST